MTKKRFYLKVFILVLPVLVCWGICYRFPMLCMERDYSIWIANKEYLEESTDDNRVLLLGDSSVQFNIDMDELPEDSYMSALGAGTPIEAYYSLKMYLQNHPAPDYVVLSQTLEQYYCDWSNTFLIKDIGYHYLCKEDIIDHFDVLKMYPDTEIAKTINWENAVRYYYRTPDIYALDMINNILHEKYQENIEIYETIKIERGSYAYKALSKSNAEENMPVKDGIFYIHPVIRYYIGRLSELCDQNGIGLIIVQAPMSDRNFNALTNSWWSDFNEGMASLENYCTVDSEIPVYDAKYFQSANHLTADGVAVFSKDFYEKWKDLWK